MLHLMYIFWARVFLFFFAAVIFIFFLAANSKK